MNRWIYANRGDDAEHGEWNQKIQLIERWWAAFCDKANDLNDLFAQRSKWDLVGWMHDYLHAIDPDLMWEFGPAVKQDGHRLVITPEGSHGRRPLVTSIIEMAPQMPGWEFYPYRLPEHFDLAMQSVEKRTGIDAADFTVTAETTDSLIHLTYHVPLSIYSSDEHAGAHAAFVITESLLGEEILDKWIGAIETAPPPTRNDHIFGFHGGCKSNTNAIALDALHDHVNTQLAVVKSNLPPKPFCDLIDDSSWALIELNPDPDRDYPRRLDQCTCVSGHVPLHQAIFSRALFHSECFSAHGETFIYLKVDGLAGLEDSEYDDRGDIEDALNNALKPDRTGCIVGSGNGLRYSYLDIACLDIEKAIEVIVNTLRQGRIPKRSWLLFQDSYLCNEWIGIHPDTPPPPMTEE